MEFKYLEKLTDDTAGLTFIKNAAGDNFDRPGLISKILEIINDGSPYLSHISQDKVLSLFRLAKESFETCFSAYLDFTTGGVKLEHMLKSGESTVYYIDAPDGNRVATINEVNNGVEELTPVTTNHLGEDVTKNLNLLLWTFTGQLRYYKKAGLTYTYKDGKLEETPLQLIMQAGMALRQLIDWMKTPADYERALRVLALSKKQGKYKYPNFAPDEIQATISIKQIQYLCKSGIVGRGATETQAEVKRLLFKIDKDRYKPLPHEIALMRRAYTEIQNGIVHNPGEKLNDELEELCSKLEKGAESGLIAPDHFAFKVIGTVRHTLRCSDKQLKILRDAERLMDKSVIKEVKKQDEDDSGADELMNMYNALGQGVLGV